MRRLKISNESFAVLSLSQYVCGVDLRFCRYVLYVHVKLKLTKLNNNSTKKKNNTTSSWQRLCLVHSTWHLCYFLQWLLTMVIVAVLPANEDSSWFRNTSAWPIMSSQQHLARLHSVVCKLLHAAQTYSNLCEYVHKHVRPFWICIGVSLNSSEKIVMTV